MIIIITLYNYVKQFLHKLNEDAISAYSAQSAYFIIMSFFPFIMLLLSLVQYLPVTPDTIFTFIEKIFPNGFDSYIIPLLKEIFSRRSAAIISFTVIAAVWASSKAFLALIRGVNAVYDIQESRNYFVLRIFSMLYTVLFAITIVLVLSLLVFGNTIFINLTTAFPSTAEIALLIISLRTIAALLFLILFFLLLYILLPNRKTTILAELPGAIMSALGWIGFSYLYSFYMDNFANYNMYGSLTIIILFMFWLYGCMYIIFLGAEINVFLQNNNIRHNWQRILYLQKTLGGRHYK